MSIASEITSIGENLKKDYQSIANLGADLTNVDKNIENIAELLDGVYDVLPKTSFQEGTEITLENCLKGKLDFDNGVVGIGQSSQDSTKGDNFANCNGMNTTTNNGVTFTINKENGLTKSVKINGTSVNYDSYCVGTAYLLKAGTYTVYGNGVTNDIVLQIVNDTQSSQLGYAGMNNNTMTLAQDTNVIIRLRVAVGKTIDNAEIKPMIATASGKDFEPYTGGQASPNPSYPQTINSVTGNQDVVVSGKNILNTLNLEPKTENGITYTPVYENGLLQYINVNGTSTAITFYEILLTTEANTNYFLSGCPSGGAYGTYRQLLIDTTDFTTSFNDYGSGVLINSSKTNWSLRIRIGSGTTINNMKFYPMVIKGSTATTYEPYITPTSYQLSLGDIELNSIGNYKDELVYDVDEDKVYKVNRIAKHVLTENDGWVYDGTTYNRIYNQSANFLNPPCKIPSSNDDPPNILCDYLMNYNATTFLADNSLNGITLSQNGTISARNTSKTTLEQYKSWLSEVKPVLYYVIGTQAQTQTEITDTTLINQVKALYTAQSINGTTIITSNGNLPMIIKVRGLKGE